MADSSGHCVNFPSPIRGHLNTYRHSPRSSLDSFGVVHDNIKSLLTHGCAVTKDYEKRSNEIKTIDGIPVRALFIANLHFTASESDVFHAFKRFGVIRKICIAHPKPQKRTKFGFVTFSSPSDAARALSMKKSIKIRSQRLYISIADSWHQPIECSDGSIIWDRRKKTFEPVDSEDSSSDCEEEICVQDNETCPILRLNDDCLLIIFSYIPLDERFALGAVCRRWRDISNVMWSSVKKLDFSKPPLCYTALTSGLFEFLVQKCINLTSLNLRKHGHRLDSSSIATIATRCKFLEDLAFSQIDLKKRSLALLARSCPNLKSIFIEACSNCHDGEIVSLITKCPKLEKITVKYNTYELSVGVWLKHLREPLKSLSLHMYDFNPEFLVQGIKNVKRSIKELSLTRCSTIRCGDLDIITETVPELISLELTGLYPDFKAHTLSHISKLKNLTHLNLERNPVVCDDFIEDLLKNCSHLKSINLSGVENNLLTTNGLCLLAKFPELTHLSLAFLEKLSDATLKSIAQKASNLKHLDLAGCSSITDEGCSSIVSLCNSLEVLDISCCKSVTSATVISAIESARLGMKKNVLTMAVEASGVDLDVDWESPHVIIDRNSKHTIGLEHIEMHDGDFFLLGDEVFYPDLYPNPLDLPNMFDFSDIIFTCSDEDDCDDFEYDDDDDDDDLGSLDSFELF